MDDNTIQEQKGLATKASINITRKFDVLIQFTNNILEIAGVVALHHEHFLNVLPHSRPFLRI